MENSLPKTICLLCCQEIHWDIKASLDRRKNGVETLTKLFCLKINNHTEEYILKLLQGPRSSLKNFSFCYGCFNRTQAAVELQAELDILKNELFVELLKGSSVLQQVTKIRTEIQRCAETYFTLVGTDNPVSPADLKKQIDANSTNVEDMFPNSNRFPDIIQVPNVASVSVPTECQANKRQEEVARSNDGSVELSNATATSTGKLLSAATTLCYQEPGADESPEPRRFLNIGEMIDEISSNESPQMSEESDDVTVQEVEDPLRLDGVASNDLQGMYDNTKKTTETEICQDMSRVTNLDDFMEENPLELGQNALNKLHEDIDVLEYEVEQEVLEGLEKQDATGNNCGLPLLKSTTLPAQREDRPKVPVSFEVCGKLPSCPESPRPEIVDFYTTTREPIINDFRQGAKTRNSSYRSTTTASIDEDILSVTCSDQSESVESSIFLEQPLSPQIPYPQSQLARATTQVLDEHAYNVNLNEDVILTIGSGASKRKAVVAKSHTCGICETTFTWEPELSLHIQDVHSSIPKDSQQWECSTCSEDFYAHRHRYIQSKKYYEIVLPSGRTRLFSTFVQLCTYHDRTCHGSSIPTSPSPECPSSDRPETPTASQAVPLAPSPPRPKKRKGSSNTVLPKRMRNDAPVLVPRRKQKSSRTCLYHVMNGSFSPAKNALKEVVECYFCTTGFKSALVLALHLQEAHWEELDLPMQNSLEFNCTRCGSIFDKSDGNTQGPLYSEVDTHLQSCYNATTNSNANLTIKLQCPMCVKVFQDETTFLEHVYDHCEPVLGSHCLICDFRAGSARRLTTHYYYSHGLTRYQEKYFFCFFCKKCYLSPNDNVPSGQLDMDILDHFKSFAATHAKCRAKGSFPPQKHLKCRKCDVQVSKMSLLFLHEDKEHWNCSLTTCFSCAENIGTYEKLQNHLAQVHKVPAFPCTVCGVLFLNAKMLAEHRKKFHLEAAWLNCAFCPATFLDIPSLKCHRSREHVDFMECRVCNQRFRTTDLRKEHENEHHNLVLRLQDPE